jgi:hypothetical protein
MDLGFANGCPQGGMNDAGLAFDGFATAPRPLRAQDGKHRFPGNPIVEGDTFLPKQGEFQVVTGF